MTYEKMSIETKIFRHSFQIDHKTKTVTEKGDQIQSTKTARKIYHQLFAKLQNNNDWKSQTQCINVKTWTEAQLIAEALTYFLGGAEVKENSLGEYTVGSKGYYNYIKQ